MSTTTISSPLHILPLLLLLLLLAPPPSAADTSNVLEDSAATSRGGGGVGDDDDGDDDDRWRRTDLSRLSDGEVSAIPVARFRALRADQLNGLGLRLRQALTQEQVAALTKEQCRALQFGFLRGQQCAAISAECVRVSARDVFHLKAAVRLNCVGFLTRGAVSALPPVTLAQLPAEIYADFGRDGLASLSSSQCRRISPHAAVFLRSCRGLQRACLGGMHHASVGALQPACVRLLNPRSLLRLQGFYAALSREAFLAQTSAQLGSYGAEECAAFPRKVWPSLRTRQCANLTEKCVRELLRGDDGGAAVAPAQECREAIDVRWPGLREARFDTRKLATDALATDWPSTHTVRLPRRPEPAAVTRANMPGLVVLVAVLVLAVHLLRRRRARAADADVDAASPSTGGEDAVHGRKTRRENAARQQYQEL